MTLRTQRPSGEFCRSPGTAVRLRPARAHLCAMREELGRRDRGRIAHEARNH